MKLATYRFSDKKVLSTNTKFVLGADKRIARTKSLAIWQRSTRLFLFDGRKILVKLVSIFHFTFRDFSPKMELARISNFGAFVGALARRNSVPGIAGQFFRRGLSSSSPRCCADRIPPPGDVPNPNLLGSEGLERLKKKRTGPVTAVKV